MRGAWVCSIEAALAIASSGIAPYTDAVSADAARVDTASVTAGFDSRACDARRMTECRIEQARRVQSHGPDGSAGNRCRLFHGWGRRAPHTFGGAPSA
jgi:hypothetical protein